LGRNSHQDQVDGPVMPYHNTKVTAENKYCSIGCHIYKIRGCSLWPKAIISLFYMAQKPLPSWCGSRIIQTLFLCHSASWARNACCVCMTQRKVNKLSSSVGMFFYGRKNEWPKMKTMRVSTFKHKSTPSKTILLLKHDPMI
jgi:hypothetical protein